jgi:hypothetical protein
MVVSQLPVLWGTIPIVPSGYGTIGIVPHETETLPDTAMPDE